MNYGYKCATKLVEKKNTEGTYSKYCSKCNEFRYPMYNVAVSMIVVDPLTNRILLIKQYGNDANILVAGYVDKGESLEEAVVRELKEETGLDVNRMHFNKSKYFLPSNTLMNNFVVFVDNANEINCNHEIDSFAWYTREESRIMIKDASLAKEFLYYYLDNIIND